MQEMLYRKVCGFSNRRLVIYQCPFQIRFISSNDGSGCVKSRQKENETTEKLLKVGVPLS